MESYTHVSFQLCVGCTSFTESSELLMILFQSSVVFIYNVRSVSGWGLAMYVVGPSIHRESYILLGCSLGYSLHMSNLGVIGFVKGIQW